MLMFSTLFALAHAGVLVIDTPPSHQVYVNDALSQRDGHRQSIITQLDPGRYTVTIDAPRGRRYETTVFMNGTGTVYVELIRPYPLDRPRLSVHDGTPDLTLPPFDGPLC